jgi:hypothetical protein
MREARIKMPHVFIALLSAGHFRGLFQNYQSILNPFKTAINIFTRAEERKGILSTANGAGRTTGSPERRAGRSGNAVH